MNDAFYSRGLDMEGDCYFSKFINLQDNGNSPSNEWEAWEHCLQSLVNGDFGVIPTLVDLWKNYKSNVLRYSASLLLADTITTSAIEYLREQMIGELDPLLRMEYAEILANVGHLESVDEILHIHKGLANFGDSEIISVRLSDMLDQVPTIPLPEDSSFEEYSQSVNAQRAIASAQFPGEKLAFFQGKPTSMRDLAKIMIRQTRSRSFEFELRRRFEATTGIDCSIFYVNGSFQPLTAAALLEDYLHSGVTDKFKDGARYFFGHKIP